jgi:L-fuconolactonase
VADRHGFPHAIVGYADPAAASLEPTLDQMMNHAHLRGIRQQLH